MRTKRFFYVFLASGWTTLQPAPNLPSEITITSTTASVEECSIEGHTEYRIMYEGDVAVRFSDGSWIKSNQATFTINPADHTMPLVEGVLHENVHFEYAGYTGSSNHARLIPKLHEFHLEGNVQIAHRQSSTAQKSSIHSMNTRCDRAVINIVSHKITLSSEPSRHVSTVLTLDQPIKKTPSPQKTPSLQPAS